MKHFISIFCLFYLCAGCDPITPRSKDSTEKISNNSKDLNNPDKVLSQAILNADTVILTSHIGREVTGLFDKSNGNLTELPALLADGRINNKIIKESKIANRETLDSLTSILTKQHSAFSGPYKCGFDPHHTIFLIRTGKISYIDFCFTCFALDTSKDLEAFDEIGDVEWHRLKNYFKSQGFKYQLE